MTFDQLTQYLSWAIYILVFVVAAARAIQRPLKANVDIALLFAAPAILISISLAASLQFFQPGPISNAITTSLLLIMIYMLFRLVDDFSIVPRWLVRSISTVLVIFVLTNFLIPAPRPTWFGMLEVVYVVGLIVYSSAAFIRESNHTSGVTKRRMRSVAFGSLSLCALFVLAGLLIFVPQLSDLARPLTDLTGLLSAIGYYMGFATPGVLRRSWQEPELRTFLSRAASLPNLPDTQSIVEELERGAASSTGAPGARIGFWNPATQLLRFKTPEGEVDFDPKQSVTGRAFLTQKAVYSANTLRDNPGNAEVARTYGAYAVLAAPITAGGKRLGVLSVYAAHAPIFAEEDLDLVQLLADQAAVILESRALIDEAARVQAREEVARLKEDFLSAAAHDLKTPLTTVVMQTELLERRALRDPNAPVDLAGLQKLKKETYRLKTLVLELLDAARTEQGKLVGQREEMDLASVAQEVCAEHNSPRHPCTVQADQPAVGMYDPNRILQLLENLVENAIKYSPEGGPVTIRLWQEKGLPSSVRAAIQSSTDGTGSTGSTGGSSINPDGDAWNHLTITDHGIGIPKEDLANVFERFHRGSNVDDRQFSGMGLGLFICRGIVEQHGGRIWVETHNTVSTIQTDGQNGHNQNGQHDKLQTGNTTYGTTFHMVLPAIPVPLPSNTAPVGANRG